MILDLQKVCQKIRNFATWEVKEAYGRRFWPGPAECAGASRGDLEGLRPGILHAHAPARGAADLIASRIPPGRIEGLAGRLSFCCFVGKKERRISELASGRVVGGT